MDGVLADSEPVYERAINAVVAALGKSISPEVNASFIGKGVEATWTAVIQALDLPGTVDDYIQAYDRELRTQLARLRQPLPGVVELVSALRERGVPIAVASSSWPGWVDALLSGLGFSDAFGALVSATMVEHPKPAPDLYLLAAQKLGIEPQHSIAIEDTPTGITAAKAAGMLAIQVRSASTAFPPLPEADIVLDTLHEFDLGLIASS
jgi:HAD superfamily hydrolase (TIGR01509 family)